MIHALESLSEDSNTFLTCSNRGELMLWDARTLNRGSLIFTPSPAAGVKRPTADGEEQGAHGMVVCGDKCATLSDSGRLNVYDRRGASSWLPLASSDLHSSESVSSWSGFKTPGHQPIRPCVQVFTHQENCWQNTILSDTTLPLMHCLIQRMEKLPVGTTR